MYVATVTESQISVRFAQRPAVLLTTGHFQISVPNNPQIALKPTM